MELESPALAGGFLTTGPPEKSRFLLVKHKENLVLSHTLMALKNRGHYIGLLPV